MAARFPRTALNLLLDCTAGVRPAHFPRRLGLFLTSRCDFACPMCAVRHAMQHTGDMPFDIIERVLAECAPYQPIVDLIGGEPLLHPRWNDAIRLASERKVPCVVTTNGLELKQRADALVRAGLPILQVSLDGWDEPSQAARGRVEGSFDRLCHGVRAVQEARGARPFPIIRILTAITRVNHAYLDRIQAVVEDLGVRYWAISNYFYLNPAAYARQRAFASINGLTGVVTGHVIPEDVYLDAEQVRDLKASLARVRTLNRQMRLRIAYAWNIDVEKYYSTREPSSSCLCKLPYTRLDVHADGRMVVCVSGKRLGQAGRESIAGIWRGTQMGSFRAMYERTRPMPMCFRCCGLSQSIVLGS